MDEQMGLNPWLPDFLQNAPQYALWLEVLQYVLFIVLTIAMFTMVCALVDLILLLRQESQQTQPLYISIVKSLMRWFDKRVAQRPLWRTVATGVHAAAKWLHYARNLRFPH